VPGTTTICASRYRLLRIQMTAGAVERRLDRALDVDADALLQVDDPAGVIRRGAHVPDRDVAGGRVQE
jgi:hypothetical protein